MKLTPEFVRLHAHLCGDGCITSYKTSEKDHKNRMEVLYFNNNPDLLDSFMQDMRFCFNVKTSKGVNRIKVKSMRIAEEFFKLTESYKSRAWRVPDVIKSASRNLKLEWIRAFSKDEGYLPSDRNRIRIKSMNLLGIGDIKEMLDSLKIHSKITGPNCDSSYYLNIWKEGDLKDFNKVKCRSAFLSKSL